MTIQVGRILTLFLASAISQTPGFSPVRVEDRWENRFNGFVAGESR